MKLDGAPERRTLESTTMCNKLLTGKFVAQYLCLHLHVKCNTIPIPIPIPIPISTYTDQYYLYLYPDLYLHLHLHLHLHPHLYIYTFIYTFIYTLIYTFICTFIYLPRHTFTCFVYTSLLLPCSFLIPQRSIVLQLVVDGFQYLQN